MLPPNLLVLALLLTGANSLPSHAETRSKGCGKAPPSAITLGKSINQTISSQSGASPRKYRIHVPSSYKNDVPVPLILSYHGRSRDMKFQEKLSRFSDPSYGFEGISVYPEGVPFGPKDTKQWQGDPDSDSISDTTFTLELLTALTETYCIDPSRVYAAGKSNGGGFTGLLACNASTSARIAAFAPVSGAFYLDAETQRLPACSPAATRDGIPVLDFHGWKDTTIPYLGGINQRGNANSTNLVSYVHGWVERNGLAVDANVTTVLCGKGKRVRRYAWGPEERVVHYNISNLGHDWPSAVGNLDTDDTTCEEADATRVILEWFKQWRL